MKTHIRRSRLDFSVIQEEQSSQDQPRSYCLLLTKRGDKLPDSPLLDLIPAGTQARTIALLVRLDHCPSLIICSVGIQLLEQLVEFGIAVSVGILLVRRGILLLLDFSRNGVPISSVFGRGRVPGALGSFRSGCSGRQTIKAARKDNGQSDGIVPTPCDSSRTHSSWYSCLNWLLHRLQLPSIVLQRLA